MAFSRPTFSQILARVQADINAGLPGADSRLRRSTLNVIAYMIAGCSHGLYGFLSWIALQVFPDTAEVENLNRWGAIWGITRKEATKSAGTVTATGVNGSVIIIGTELQRSDGTLFLTIETKTISSGTAIIPVESSGFGKAGNTATSSTLNFISTPIGVASAVTVITPGLFGGADVETDASYLSRILRRIQQPPHGGAGFDYVTWALEVPGVTRAWVYNVDPFPGYVTVRFMMDDTYDDGIPEAGDVETVQAYIEERRPVTAKVIVLAPVADVIDFTIQLKPAANDTAEVRAAVQAELIDMILRDGEPGGTIYISRINAAISSASGQFDHVLTVPAADVVYAEDFIPVFGEITWIPA